jgi:prevent-host-death family protein
MVEVTATEFQNKFGRYRALAHRNLVPITSHGNPDLVAISAEEYKRLKSRDRHALFAWKLSTEEIEALVAVEVLEASADFNHKLEM